MAFLFLDEGPPTATGAPVAVLFFVEDAEMFEAIVAREVTKQFGTYLPQPHLPSWKRMPRLGFADIHSSETQAGQIRSNASQNVVAVDRVSFGVGQGEIFGLVGPTGSGKSTLIRLLAALIAPDHGELLVFGYDVAGQPLQVKRLVNRVSVESSFFRQLSPVENLTYSARLYGKSGTELRRRYRNPYSPGPGTALVE